MGHYRYCIIIYLQIRWLFIFALAEYGSPWLQKQNIDESGS